MKRAQYVCHDNQVDIVQKNKLISQEIVHSTTNGANGALTFLGCDSQVFKNY